MTDTFANTHAFYGVLPAIITPLQNDQIAYEAFKNHLAFLKAHDVDGVVVSGTTGAALTLSLDEQKNLCAKAVEIFKDKPVIFGINAACLSHALQQAHSAHEAGASALLVSPPFYVKPDAIGLYTYFESLHNAATLPLVLYNNPGRVGAEIPLSVFEKLATLPRVVGIKEASPQMGRIAPLKAMRDWSLLGGDDATWPAFLALGGAGIISVGANIAPHLYVDLCQAWQEKDLCKAQCAQEKLDALHAALGNYPNPIGIQTACAFKGWGDGRTRLPLTPLKAEEKEKMRTDLDALGVLS